MTDNLLKKLSLNILRYSFSGGTLNVADSEETPLFMKNTGVIVDDSVFVSWLMNNTLSVTSAEPYQSEYYCRRTNRWFCVRTVLDGDYFSVFSDVTEYKSSEEHLRTLINSTPDIICFKDGKGRWIEANKSDLELFALTDADYKNKTDLELADYTLPMYKEAFAACEVSDEATWQSGRMCHVEEIIPLSTGGYRVYDVIKVPLFYDEEKKNRKGLVVLGRDVTDRKEAENQIKRQSSFINSLLDSVPDLIFFKDLNRTYVLCNPAFAEFVGRPVEAIVGSTDHDLFDKTVADDFVSNDSIMINAGKSRENKEWVTYPDGRKILLATLKTPYYDKEGNIIGILGISRDITELHKKTDELTALNNSLEEKVRAEVEKSRHYEQVLFNQKKLADMGRLMSSISHHWRQPLNAIGLYIQDMCQGYTDGTIDDVYMDRFGRETMNLVENLSGTIDNFRNFFKPSNKLESFEIINDLYELLRILHAEFIHHNISLCFTCSCNRETFRSENLARIPECKFAGTEVTGYKDEFNQAMLNIMQNAVDASIEAVKSGLITRGRVEVGISVSDDKVCISIFNLGQQIPENIADKIFDPYFTTKIDGRGTGIGLFNAKIVLENYMRGHVIFNNRENGVEFVVSVPKLDISI